MSIVKIGQVWRDKDKRRNTVIEIIKVTDAGDAMGLVVGTEDVRGYTSERLTKRWELIEDKTERKVKISAKDVKEIAAIAAKEIKPKHKTREQWLVAATALIYKGVLAEHGNPEVRVSVGWPGGRGPKKNTIGQCWLPDSSTDNVSQIFISPVLSDPVEVLETLVHELIHAITQKVGYRGHGAAFGAIARPVGLEGKLTATHAGEELREVLEGYAEKLGEYPHAAIRRDEKPTVQKTYMRKVVSVNEPDYFVRMTQTKIEEYGLPRDPWGDEMELED